MVFILLLAAKSEFGAFIKLVGVSFPGNVHHHQVFVSILSFHVGSLFGF